MGSRTTVLFATLIFVSSYSRAETFEECIATKPPSNPGSPIATPVMRKVVDPSVFPLDEVSGKKTVNLVHGDLKKFREGLNRQIANCSKSSKLGEVFEIGTCKMTRQAWCLDSNRKLLAIANKSKSMRELVDASLGEFDWYELEGPKGSGNVFFTGYNSPTLEVSRIKAGDYKYPIFAKPPELVRVVDPTIGKSVWRVVAADGSYVKFPPRAAIDTTDQSKSVMSGRGLEIAYAKDLFDIYILQLEGAGTLKIREKNGKITTAFANYAASNGQSGPRPAKVLRCQGLGPEHLTIPGMRKYFALHPDQLAPVLNYDQSYVFFIEQQQGPMGVDGLQLTAGVSMATDTTVVPIGYPLFYSTKVPVGVKHPDKMRSMSRMGITQDIGGAIKGAHFDLFWGGDAYAELASGVMKERGSLFIPVTKNCP